MYLLQAARMAVVLARPAFMSRSLVNCAPLYTPTSRPSASARHSRQNFAALLLPSNHQSCHWGGAAARRSCNNGFAHIALCQIREGAGPAGSLWPKRSGLSGRSVAIRCRRCSGLSRRRKYLAKPRSDALADRQLVALLPGSSIRQARAT